MIALTLLGAPKSTNHIYKYACRGSFPCMYMTADGKALKEDYQWQARGQFHGAPPSGPLQIVVTIYFPTKRRSDWDNFHKISMDALSAIVWDDDSQIEDAGVLKRYDKERPRIEITVSPVIPEAS